MFNSIFISDVVVHTEEETQKCAVNRVFYRENQTHTQTAHYRRWWSQGCRAEHNQKLSRVPPSACPKQAPACWKAPFTYMADLLLCISRHPRGQIWEGWCGNDWPFWLPFGCLESPATAARGLSTRQLHPGSLLLLTIHTTDTPCILATLSCSTPFFSPLTLLTRSSKHREAFFVSKKY